jgi:hypothetical protein
MGLSHVTCEHDLSDLPSTVQRGCAVPRASSPRTSTPPSSRVLAPQPFFLPALFLSMPAYLYVLNSLPSRTNSELPIRTVRDAAVSSPPSATNRLLLLPSTCVLCAFAFGRGCMRDSVVFCSPVRGGLLGNGNPSAHLRWV